VKDANTIKHSFANSGTHATTGVPTTVYWYAALKKLEHKKKFKNKCMPYIFPNIQ
jgi:hypothetical protein